MTASTIGLDFIPMLGTMSFVFDPVTVLGIIGLVVGTGAAFYLIGDGYWKLTVLWGFIFLLGQGFIWMGFCFANEELLSDDTLVRWLFPMAVYSVLLVMRTQFWIFGLVIRFAMLLVMFQYFADLGSAMDQFIEMQTYLVILGITTDLTSIVMFTAEEAYPWPLENVC